MRATRLLHWWTLGWWRAAHLGLDVVLSVLWWLLLVLLVLGTVLTPVLGVGIPVLLLARLLLSGAAGLERRRLGWVGVDVPTPHRVPRVGAWWRRTLLDPGPWRTVGHLAVVGSAGLLGGAVVLGLAGTGVAAVLAPSLRAGDGTLSWPYGIPGTVPLGDGLLVASGVVLVLLVPVLAHALTAAERTSGPRSLGPVPAQREAQLRARVETLTETRERAVDSVEAERRRIERDLHDGPQQRLVSLAMQLGMAKRALERSGPDAARPFLDAASTSAGAAIADMRSVARGVHPPVLTDRGLDAALSALAASVPVPVDLDVDLDAHRTPGDRPSPTAEAIAYFCVSEALTNVAKHAAARGVSVTVRRDAAADGPVLHVEVTDDGRGGAHVGNGTVAEGGSGLRGMSDRVAAVEGSLRVDSPPGGPTRLDVRIPWSAGGPR